MPILVWLAVSTSCRESSPYSAGNVAWLWTVYPGMSDAGVGITNGKVEPSGNVTCAITDYASRVQWQGQMQARDTTIPDLLARPGLVHDLATPCPLTVYDGGPYIITHFTIDEDHVDHSRLVMSSCWNANLGALIQALQRIQDACLSTASAPTLEADGGVAQ